MNMGDRKTLMNMGSNIGLNFLKVLLNNNMAKRVVRTLTGRKLKAIICTIDGRKNPGSISRVKRYELLL